MRETISRGAEMHVVVPGQVAGVVVGDLLRAGDRLRAGPPRAAPPAARCGGRPRSAPPKSGYSFASVLKQCGQLATIFVTPASFIVATFCSAYDWKVYSFPIRRAGSPVHDSRGPRTAKSTPAACSSLRRRLGGRARPLVEGGGAADPVEHLGRRLAGLQHAHVEPFRPVGPLRLRLAPRVLRALDVAQHRLAVRREAALDHDEVAAQVDDVVDVLDRHRALLDARAARDAVPDDVVADGVRHERASARTPAASREQVRPFREELIAQPHDQELRRQLLARRVGGADVLAAAALGARHRVDHLLPGHVGDRVRRRSASRSRPRR